MCGKYLFSNIIPKFTYINSVTRRTDRCVCATDAAAAAIEPTRESALVVVPAING